MARPKNMTINGQAVKSIKINGQLWWKKVSEQFYITLSVREFRYDANTNGLTPQDLYIITPRNGSIYDIYTPPEDQEYFTVQYRVYNNGKTATYEITPKEEARYLPDGSSVNLRVYVLDYDGNSYTDAFYIQIDNVQEEETYEGWYLEETGLSNFGHYGSYWEGMVHYNVYNSQGEFIEESHQTVSGDAPSEWPGYEVNYSLSHYVGTRPGYGDVYLYLYGSTWIND